MSVGVLKWNLERVSRGKLQKYHEKFRRVATEASRGINGRLPRENLGIFSRKKIEAFHGGTFEGILGKISAAMFKKKNKKS